MNKELHKIILRNIYCPNCFSDKRIEKNFINPITGEFHFNYICLNCKKQNKSSKFIDLESMRNMKIDKILIN
jgi:DNA-directed RNA polymerase subunit RPC12/RpoP